ncbi:MULTISPECIES: SLOG family protein [unclassified Rhizobium]|uniref:SLOG family protein n=1 Tax=unclassified Rhizobium TaxID=2613769 RepID=UPI003815BBBF
MRLLIHGGNGVARLSPIQTALGRIHARRGISLIIHGEAPTVRAAVDRWARENAVDALRYPANWSMQGPDSETRWISLMLRDSRPDIILQLPCDGSEIALHRAADQLAIPVIVVRLNRQGRLAGYRAIAGLGKQRDRADVELQEDRMCQPSSLHGLKSAGTADHRRMRRSRSHIVGSNRITP